MSASAFENDLQSPKQSSGLVAAVIVLIFALVISLGVLAIVSLRLSESTPKQQADAIENAYQQGYDEGYQAGANEATPIEDSDTLAQEYNRLNQSYKAIIEKYDQYKAEVSFWSRDNVIVAMGGTEYHAFGCEKISKSAYKVYHVNDANNHGFTRCESCSAPAPFDEESRRLVPITIW